MLCRRYSYALVASGVCLLSLMAARSADAPPPRASVHDRKNLPVAKEEVRIENVATYMTSDSGEFEFPRPQSTGRDPAFRFRVKNWVITEPCVLRNGRVYLPVGGSIEIKVYRMGDDALIDVAQGA